MGKIKSRDKAHILLSNGMLLEGKSLGAKGEKTGEFVFATGMTGYLETLTDPSYFGQIVIQTFPLVGNYGVNMADAESAKAHVSGYIIRESCENPSNFRTEGTLEDFLTKQEIVGICDVDTRCLTRIIRESGVMNGMITTEYDESKKEEYLAKIRSFQIENAVASVSTKEVKQYETENSKGKVVLIDYGYKGNILRSLLCRGYSVTVVPYNYPAEKILALCPDGIMLSNGPGDPAENVESIAVLRELYQSEVPIFGICLGHQLSALANGAKTQKLKYGHRGTNQPVVDRDRDRTFVTSQNHGYAVVGETLPPQVGRVSHINANDGSCEGIKYSGKKAFTVQFHPEACAGPQDTAYLFDEFIRLMGKGEPICR